MTAEALRVAAITPKTAAIFNSRPPKPRSFHTFAEIKALTVLMRHPQVWG